MRDFFRMDEKEAAPRGSLLIRHRRSGTSEAAESGTAFFRSGFLPYLGQAQEIRDAIFLRDIPLADQHTIAVTVEAVARFDGMPVRGENIYPACKRTHQCQQGRARQVEIRQQRVHHTKTESRNNK